MIVKTKLSHAIGMVLASTVISVAATTSASAEALVSYNAFNHDRPAPNDLMTGTTGTDGWMRTTTSALCGAGCSHGYGPNALGGPSNNDLTVLPGGNGAVPWVGNDPRNTNALGTGGFGYVGMQTLNWTVELGASEAATVSKIDSFNRYGGSLLDDGTTFNYADIDSAKGAWHDGKGETVLDPETGDPIVSVGNGWRHDTDIGLFRSSVTQSVTLSIASLLESGEIDQTPDYGFTIFEGMDTRQATSIASFYGHHAPWHTVANGTAIAVGDNAKPITPANPFFTEGVDILVLDDVVGNSATFTAEAGKIYTIYLGGFQGGDWTITRNDYQLSISAAPVPLPNAVWLFGSTLVGLIGIQRRKHKTI